VAIVVRTIPSLAINGGGDGREFHSRPFIHSSPIRSFFRSLIRSFVCSRTKVCAYVRFASDDAHDKRSRSRQETLEHLAVLHAHDEPW
jgi:hypothetical protein